MRKTLLTLMLTAITVISAVPTADADVSSAAVLFLRIAAGARAAGMGEAFVAVADDATATHWNPAGLGTYPLSYKWLTVDIPEQYRPVRKIASFRNSSSGQSYEKYDIWVLSDEGLIRHQRNDWKRGEVVETDPRETAAFKLARYTGLVGETAEREIPGLLEKLGRANNPYHIEKIDTIAADIRAALNDNMDVADDIDSALTAIRDGYNGILVDWDALRQARGYFDEAMKDSVLSQSEADKLYFALKKANRKYMPEEIIIPFDINFKGAIVDIAASGQYLWAATETELYRYDGDKWQRFGEMEGLPAVKIRNLKVFDFGVFILSNEGLVRYAGGGFTYFGPTEGLPVGNVGGVAAQNKDDVWAMVDGDLYHYDGKSWKNYFEYNDVLRGDYESIYNGMKLFGTAREHKLYLGKIAALNEAMVSDTMSQVSPAASPADSAGALVAEGQSSFPTDSARTVAAVADTAVAIGRLVKIPYMVGLSYEVTDMEVDKAGRLWIGTEFGLLRYDSRQWNRYGYTVETIKEDMTVYEFALSKVSDDPARAERLAHIIRSVNELESDSLVAGQNILRYANPAGARIHDIRPANKKIYFATESGTIVYEYRWSRYNEGDLSRRNTIAVEEHDGNLWFATTNRVMVRAAAKGEITMMHVNWLPELADDIYYEFFSYVRNIPEWGTLGGNITFLSYGNISQTDPTGQSLGDFSAFDVALTLSYGTPLTTNLSGGVSAKIIYSHLSDQGAGAEQGSGTSTGLALDLGLLYRMSNRWTLGVAMTNLGPDISYIDVAQADPLPRNLAIGVATYLVKSDFNNVLLTAEMNKSLVGLDDSFSDEIREIIYNAGAEYRYGSFIAFRGGYIYDQEGEVKTPTLGFGLAYKLFNFDFAYIPSNDNVPLANTMRLSLSIGI